MRKFKSLKIVIFVLTILILAGFLSWQFVLPNYAEKLIKEKIISKNIKLEDVRCSSRFPYLVIAVRKLSVDSNITAEHIESRISPFQVVLLVISGKKFVSSIHIEKANVNITKKVKKVKMEIPYLLNIVVEHAYIKDEVRKINACGKVKARIGQKIKFCFSGSAYGENIKIDDAEFSYRGQLDFSDGKIVFSARYLKWISLSLNSIKAKADIRGKLLKDIYLSSKNGYKIKGNVNFEKKSVFLDVSTPFIEKKEIDPIVLYISPKLPKVYENYLLSYSIKIDELHLKGKTDSLDVVKTGKMTVNNLSFRVEEHTDFFKDIIADIDVKPGKVTIDVNKGKFSKVDVEKGSNLIIYRKKHYPCDILLKLDGQIDKKTIDFLKFVVIPDDILSKVGDIEFKGHVLSVVSLKNYQWHSHPYFPYDVKLNLKNTSVKCKNFPYIKYTDGNWEIKRTLPSTISVLVNKGDCGIYDSKIFIDRASMVFPEEKFLIQAKTKLNKKDSRILSKQYFPQYLNIDTAISGDFTAQGNFKKYSFTVKFTTKDDLSVSVCGKHTKNYTDIEHFSARDKSGQMEGKLKLSREFEPVFCHLTFNRFNPAVLQNLIQYQFPIESALISGSINLYPQIEGKLSVEKLKTEWGIDDASFTVYSQKNHIHIPEAKMVYEGNELTFSVDGERRNKNYIFHGDVKTDNFLLSSNKQRKEIILPYIPKNVIFNVNVATKKLKVEHEKMTAVIEDVCANVNFEDNTLYIRSFAPYFLFVCTVNFEKQPTIHFAFKDNTLFRQLFASSVKTEYVQGNGFIKTNRKINLNNAKGEIKIEAKRGEIKHFPALYKVFSITNIAEFLTLNFPQIEKGLVYKEIVANIKLNNGLLSIKDENPLIIKGKNLNMFFVGDYRFSDKHINGIVTFTTFRTINQIISSIPVLGWIIGGKEKSFTGLSFRVKGKIDNKMTAYPVPLTSLSKGMFNIIKRTLTSPLHLF
jgi:hypothetical protein